MAGGSSEKIDNGECHNQDHNDQGKGIEHDDSAAFNNIRFIIKSKCSNQ